MSLPKLTDVRQLFPSQYLNHTYLIDPQGKWRTLSVTIDRVDYSEVEDAGRKQDKYILHFKTRSGQATKPLVMNTSHMKALLSLRPKGTALNDWLPQNWVGLQVTLYIDPNVKAPPKWKPIYGKTMPGIRIRGRDADVEDMKDQLRAATPEPAPEYDDDASTH